VPARRADPGGAEAERVSTIGKVRCLSRVSQLRRAFAGTKAKFPGSHETEPLDRLALPHPASLRKAGWVGLKYAARVGTVADLFTTIFGASSATAFGQQSVLRRVRRRDASFAVDTPNEIGIVLTLSETHRVERRMAGRLSSEVPRIGAVTIMPPGSPARFTMTGPARVLMVRLRWPTVTAWLAEDHGVDPDHIEVQPRLHADDPALARLLYRMAAGGGVVEDIGRSVAVCLLANHAPRPFSLPVVPARGGLPPARLRRVLDRIESDLAGPVPLAVLASEAGLSPFHFGREFRRATGTSPGAHLIRRRVDRAITLLADRGTSVAEAARGAGFTHVSHLARHMRRLTGLSPARFRADVLP